MFFINSILTKSLSFSLFNNLRFQCLNYLLLLVNLRVELLHRRDEGGCQRIKVHAFVICVDWLYRQVISNQPKTDVRSFSDLSH